MPPLSRRFLVTAALALLTGTVLGFMLLLQRGAAIPLLHWLTVIGAGLQVVGIAAGLAMLQPRIRASVARVTPT